MKLPALRIRRPALAAGALAIALAAGLALRSHSAPAPAPPAAEAALELTVAEVAAARSEPVAATLAVSGLLQPLSESVLTAEVEGRVDAVLVRPGEAVKAGQALARMDSRDLAARRAEAGANLAAARAQFELAEKTQRRNEELQARHFISANSLDTSRSGLDAAREALRARDAQLALAQQALERSTIRAPQAGIVAERAVQPGQHVGLNMRLFSIVDLAELEFAAAVPVAEIGAVRGGQRVSVVAEGSDKAADGRVERIAPTADAATRMIPIYIRVANPDGRLKGGMAVRGQVKLAEASAAVTLPREALRRQGDGGGGTAVLVVRDGRTELRAVTTGINDAARGRIEITSGIAAGETAILARVALAPGRTVAVRTDAAAH